MLQNTVLQFLTDNQTLVYVGIVTGLLIRWVPVIGKIPNWVTPWLNALLIFFGAWSVPAANAGILGDLSHGVSGLGKVFISGGIAALQSVFYEVFLHHPVRILEAKGLVKKQ